MQVAASLAFNELEHAVSGAPRIYTASQLDGLPSKAPLFVTWTKNGSLRGCIGTFCNIPIYDGIKQYALIAALEDTRFSPIRANELSSLEVAVTLLSPLEKCKDIYDWELGIHGVKAIFKNGRSSTYLPEVPEEQGWDKEETIEALAEKAGVYDTDGLQLFKYTGEKVKSSYKEYKANP